jgi:hypothetical protein
MPAHRSIEEITRMTDNYPYASTPPQRGEPLPPASAEEHGPADVIKSQADPAKQAAESVKAAATDAATAVKDETASSAHDVRDQARTAATP